MQDKQPWQMPGHTLRFPINLAAGGQVAAVELRPFSVAEHRAAIEEAGTDEDDRFEALLRLSSGLEQAVIDELKRPDYMSLVGLIHEYISLPASYFLGAKPKDPDDAPLLIPIKRFGGQMLGSLQLQVPTLKVTKAMCKLKTDAERADFCTSACTGLSVPEVQSLSIPDWNQLQERLHNFLNKPADFFQ